jgi:hypothetical protein
LAVFYRFVTLPWRAAQAVVSPVPIDARVGRPPAPEHLSGHAKELWQKLTFSRRPGWFSGSEDLLAAYVATVMQVRPLDRALSKMKPSTSERYVALMRQWRQVLDTAGTLGTRLRLTPSSKLDKRTPQDGNLPVA